MIKQELKGCQTQIKGMISRVRKNGASLSSGGTRFVFNSGKSDHALFAAKFQGQCR